MTVHAVTLGIPRSGTWCDDCQTTTRTSRDIHQMLATGVATLLTVTNCTNCGDIDMTPPVTR